MVFVADVGSSLWGPELCSKWEKWYADQVTKMVINEICHPIEVGHSPDLNGEVWRSFKLW